MSLKLFGQRLVRQRGRPMIIRPDGAAGQAGCQRNDADENNRFHLAAELVSAGCAICTVMPSAMESGGLLMTRSLGVQAAQDFNRVAEIAAELDGTQLHLVVAADDGDLHSLRAENERVVGNRQHRTVSAASLKRTCA